eukprot:g4921.t1
MSSTNENLKQLSIAEQKATKLVAEAREERQKRLREAKSEATDKLTQYRQSKEEEFKSVESSYLGGSEEKIKGDIAASTDTEIASMKEEYNANKKRGVDMLVDIVKKVEYTIPKALKDMYNDK